MNKTILIVAYACEPDKGSEPGVGWNWTKQIAKNNKVIVITRKNNKPSIDNAIGQDPILKKNSTFYYYDPNSKLAFWKHGSYGLQLYYLMWQIGVKKIARSIIEREKVDYIFLPTFGNLWKPTFVYDLPCDFIWGPVGGGECVPKELVGSLSNKQQIMEKVRRLNFKIPLTNPWFYRICKKAKIIIVRTEDSLRCIPQKYRSKCHIMIETGVEQTDCEHYSEGSILPSESEDFLIIGRLISLKFVDIGIKAFERIASEYPKAKLHILGDGECRADLEKLTQKIGLGDKIIFHGNVKREEVLNKLSTARALLMTSSKEGGAWVLFEAMMCKRPILCMDTAGMHVVVPNDSGIKLSVSSYEVMVDRYAKAIRMLLQDGALADKMGETGYNHVSTELLWDSKGLFFESLI